MSLQQLLEALRDGKASLDETRQGITAGSSGTAAVDKPPVSLAVSSADTITKRLFPIEQLHQELVDSLAAALYMEPGDIELDLSFSEMGLDSIVGVEWINAINKQYGIKIPATRVYDYPNLLSFAEFLENQLREAGRTSNLNATQRMLLAAERQVTDIAKPQISEINKQADQPVVAQTGIAIIGMSGRYPDADNLNEFWDNLAQGKNAIREIPKSRWDLQQYYDPDPNKAGKTYCMWLGALDDIDCFDPTFFMLSPAEAEVMDPQYRIFLEEAYKAFEDAGYSPQSLSNRKCGVYMGIMSSEYIHLLSQQQTQGLNTGNSHSIAAARIPYFLNLKGPALPIDTACSSSLVATHLACQALSTGEIEMAVAGGVTLYLTPASYIGMCAAGMLSPDGQCKTFDEGADGFVPGEGAGTLLLKRLEDAQRDGDHIYGVIIGSGINQDGTTNGITAPSVNSQAELERDVYQRFAIDPSTIDYIEAHGTGTKLGDPIELEALTTVFREYTDHQGFCGLGSVKSNIGHTSASAGMAGIHKMLLSLHHEKLAPSLNFKKANPHCDFHDSPFYVNTELKPWPANDRRPRRTAVSSFGFSGTNAHVVIEEYIEPLIESSAQYQAIPAPVVLSAKSEERLKEVASRLVQHLTSSRRQSTSRLKDLTYTLQVGRDAMEERLALVVSTVAELAEKINAFLADQPVKGMHRGRVRRVKGKLNLHKADAVLAKAIDFQVEKGKYDKLLEHWVQGLVYDWNSLYGEEKPQRISLPTYPFARERYWVGRDYSKQNGVVDKLPEPVKVSLQQPAEIQVNFRDSATPPAFGTVQLKDLVSQGEQTSHSLNTTDAAIANAALSIEPVDEGEGVFRISLERTAEDHQTVEQIQAALMQTLRRLNEDPQAKVVMLTGGNEYFLPHGPKVSAKLFGQLKNCLTQECGLPIIAIMKGGSAGMGWLLGSLCDFMVCSEEGQYLYDARITDWHYPPEACDFMAIRFASGVIDEWIAVAKPLTGKVLRQSLQEKGNAIACMPNQVIDGFAMKMARDMARAPRESLIQLKQHFSHDLLAVNQDSIVSTPLLDLDESAGKDVKALDPGASLNFQLSSRVIELSVYKNGVLLIRLNDQESKNTFSEALALGIEEAFEHIQQIPEYKAVVITGFDHYFACGGTREALLAIQEGTARFTDSKIAALPLQCDIPVIAAMQGHGIGAGWAMGMFCDHVLFSEESIYHSPYMQYGFTPGAGSTLIFPSRLGSDLGKEILFTAREYKGQALRARGINAIVLPRSQVVTHALSMANRLAFSDRETLVQTKAVRVQGLRDRLESVYSLELSMHEKTFVGNREVRSRIEQQFTDQKPVKDRPLSEPLIAAESTATQHKPFIGPIMQTLRESLAAELHMQVDKIADDVAFIEMGLDSINSVTWVRELNQRYGLNIAATEVYNHPTLREFAEFIFTEGRLQGLFVAEHQSVQPATIVPLERPEKPVQRIESDRPLPVAVQAQDIAVIGMSGQFPKAKNLTEFWTNLSQGLDCISEVPPERWSLEKYYDPNPDAPGKTYSKWMGILEDVDKFDPLFFNISPLEAQSMDPQQRLFLEAAWSCIEDAGYDPLQLSGTKCGVFAGCGQGDYGLSLGAAEMDASALMGGSSSMLAARIAYLLNLQGPCMALDTACSSSLVAIASACDSLLLGNSSMALAGGVSVMFGPMIHIMTSKAGMLSPDGRCFTFDRRANGFVPGEGVGVVLLKRLEDAERDGDRIAGVIRGWGVNQDGKSNGITAPNGDSQTRLEKEVYDRFGLNPEDLQLMETHGTGTKLGDPIEVAGLKSAFRHYTDKQNYCALESVKSNLGHLLAASGVAGVIKTLLAMNHRKLPGMVNYQQLNEHIELEGSPFYVNSVCKDWGVTNAKPRRAAVSSFGFSGTNAHVVIEEYRAETATDHGQESTTPVIILLSAKNKDRLIQSARNLHQYLLVAEWLEPPRLQDIAYTLQTGRSAMDERLGLVVSSVPELLEKLQSFVAGKSGGDNYQGSVRHKGSHTPHTAANEAIEAALEHWIKQRVYSKLVEVWVEGFEVDWERLYSEHKPKRVSLPGYPFARERYWKHSDKHQAEQEVPIKTEVTTGTFLCHRSWEASGVTADISNPAIDHRLVLLCGLGASQTEAIKAQSGVVDCRLLHSEEQQTGSCFEDITLQVYRILKETLARKGREKVLVQLVITSQGNGRLLSGILGMFKTARLENPKIIGQVIELDTDEGLADRLLQNIAGPVDDHIRYGDGERFLPIWKEVVSTDDVVLPWKEKGVYLITGGAGRLGLAFAQEIIHKIDDARLILSGRSSLSMQQEDALDALRATGATIDYRQVDVAETSAVNDLIAEIRKIHGQLDGIIHAAGTIQDNFIINKSATEFRRVLAAKVKGTVNLDLAVDDLSLDFFVLFSSVSGEMGNPGQADYATANAFLDAYAFYRNDLVSKGRRKGLTKAINWPLWEAGGMRVDRVTENLLRENTGQAPLSTADGMRAFYLSMANPLSQVQVLSGDVNRIRQGMLEGKPRRVSTAEPVSSCGVDFTQLRDKTLHLIKQLLGDTIHLQVDRIDSHEPLHRYGIDSILVTKLNQRLQQIFPELSQTIFFEIRNLGELADYLVDEYPQSCISWTGFDDGLQTPALSPVKQVVAEDEARDDSSAKRLDTNNLIRPVLASDAKTQELIAIIGISGRYAQAETVDELWQNLRDGRDSVIEIPSERWPLEGFYHDDPQEAVRLGKSYSKWGSFLEGFAEFDPLFFNISPLAALGLDPQERLFLQASWEVLETAGYTRERIAKEVDGNVGVFAGITKTGFDLYRSDWERQGETARPQTSFGSVANRVSYLFNLNGPSMPIDTMCSSSLTAIHEACEQLRHKACEMAIAGGVNLYLHPSSYIDLSAQYMLSRDGRCKSFGKDGNGFVPGEGVGVVLLKPLSKAIEDGDSIDAIIRGSSVNHGGKTNGYTVPNPNAQSRLIRDALDKAAVDARMVSYIEAHGTGTELGDPIEVTGLTQAFRGDTSETGFCSLGSAKSNLGHLEAAAGIAGLTKVVMQMRHGQISPSLHAGELNPKIDFSKTPFKLQKKLQDWQRPRPRINGEENECPRIAGISSFGAGGANAHILIQEPPVQARSKTSDSGPVIIPLSAKTEDRLLAYVEKLNRFLTDCPTSAIPELGDIAFTLQTGREAMDERLGFIVSSVHELQDKLQLYLYDPENTPSCYRSHVLRNRDSLNVYTDDEDMILTIDAWYQKRKLANLLELWIKGLPMDWEKLYGDERPHRIALPTYPFARERYWVDIDRTKVAVQHSVTQLHPLLHENTSTILELGFSSFFTGKEFFSEDHVVGGQKILPGVACLEMARVAAEKLVGTDAENPAATVLRNIVWAQPVVVTNAGVETHIGLHESNKGELAYEVYTTQTGAERLVHSQGIVVFDELIEASVLDLSALQSTIRALRFDSRECYAVFKSMGMSYGPHLKGVDELFVGNGQVLARIIMPQTLIAVGDDYVLHPTLLDSAIQSSIGLMMADEGHETHKAEIFLPYALEQLELLSPCTNQMWAWIRPNDPQLPDGSLRRLNIDLCDESGNVCVRMKHFTFRRYQGEIASDRDQRALLVHPLWIDKPLTMETTPAGYAEHHLLLCGVEGISLTSIESLLPAVFCHHLSDDNDAHDHGFETIAAQTFGIIKDLLSKPLSDRLLIQVVVSTQNNSNPMRGLFGLLKTAQLENPRLIVQLIEMEPNITENALLQRIVDNSRYSSDSTIKFQQGRRHVISWQEITFDQHKVDMPWRQGGVYLITGGMGGLGLIFAEEIVNTINCGHLILTGRSESSTEFQKRLHRLAGHGVEVVYRKADVSNRDEVNRLINGIESDYGVLNGILHGAGIIRDNFIINKEIREFHDVLAPKIAGATCLDSVTRDMDLDFFVLFSAGAGVLGNPGQVDYAAANAFLDEFARYRNLMVTNQQRRGLTLSIDWPLWEEGGMKVDETTITAMQSKLGMRPMSTAAGIDAFYRAIASGKDQVLVLAGDHRRLRALLDDEPELQPERGATAANLESVAAGDNKALEIKVIDYFSALLSSTLKLPIHRVNPDESFALYGIDSVIVMNLTNELEKHFGSLPKTLFFEFQSIRSLSGYFIKTYPDSIGNIIGLVHEGEVEQITEKTPVFTNKAGTPQQQASLSDRDTCFASQRQLPDSLDIAIIGLSGRYPKSPDMEAYWNNLKEGVDCITEVPADRWDWRDYYSDDPMQVAGHSSKWGGFLDDVDSFDPQFFNISPRVAPFIDPQERLILEETWKAMEDAGYCRSDFQEMADDQPLSQIGVYIGAMYGEYQLFGAEASMAGTRMGFAGNLASIANRVSYVFNLQGPSMMVDTMCSGSLTCIHLACQDLKQGRTRLAIAGGVNLTIHPNKYLMLSGGQFLSSEGRCESFGEGGGGYIPSEGVGVVLLKRLSDAERDGDHIYGVIKGSAVNHGGRTNGYSVPNPNAQQRVIAQAMKEAGIDPSHVSYVEAHGTGTKLGDPIEINGLTRAFGKQNDALRCWIGSAKSNIGHCESAAGIAGLTKVLLQMKHRQIAPSLHSQRLNPHIDFESTPFRVNQTLRDWEPPVIGGNSVSRIAGVSSFGAGGSNAHIVIEDYAGNTTSVSSNHAQGIASSDSKNNLSVIVLSARNEDRLMAVAQNLHQYLSSTDRTQSIVLQDIAYTLETGREAMQERLGFGVRSIEELNNKLKDILDRRIDMTGVVRGCVEQAHVNQAADDAAADNRRMKVALEAWAEHKSHTPLLELWVQGVDIDWEQLYSADMPRRRISLPTYPFTRQRYWVEIDPVKKPGVTPVTTDQQTLATSALSDMQVEPALEKPRGLPLTPLSATRKTVTRITDNADHESEDAASDSPSPMSQPSTVAGDAPVEAVSTQPAPAIPDEALREDLLVGLANILYLDKSEVSLDKPFIDMGLDSIIGVEWVKAINEQYGLSILATQVYEYPNLRQFATFIQGELKDTEEGSGSGNAPVINAKENVPEVMPLAELAPEQNQQQPLPPVMEVSGSSSLSKRAVRQDEALATQPTSAVFSDRGIKVTDIAVVGMSGKFPGGESLDEFWHLLKTGQSAFTDLPEDRFGDLSKIYHETQQPNKTYVSKGGFLKAVDKFDPLFFNISPKEAVTMDPGERIFLQESWHAIEDAGIDPLTISGQSWGVFCGNGGDYSLLINKVLGYSPHVTLSQVPARVSNYLNLTGPSLSVDAGCASSLLAIAQACEHLVDGRCEVAIAGGVLIHSTPNLLISASQIEILSQTNSGCAFDRSATGMMPAEGAGVLILKPLTAALEAGDRIHGVIEGWGNNHNGRTNGMVSPSVESEAALFSEVYDRFDIDVEDIRLVEANATGLPLADTAEVRALTKAFRKGSAKRRYCALGSVENNVGHAFHAAGMSHVMKVLLTLRHQKIPATLNVGSPHERMDLDNSPFFINCETIPWPIDGSRQRRAAVSSFGATGANVHLVIAEPPVADDDPSHSQSDNRDAALIVLSAKTPSALTQRCRDLAGYLQKESERDSIDLQRLSANLLLRRSHFTHRYAIVTTDIGNLLDHLLRTANGETLDDALVGCIETDQRLGSSLALLAEIKIKALVDNPTANVDDLTVLADLYVRGVNLDLSAYFTACEKAPLSLPTYPFEKRRCWINDAHGNDDHPDGSPSDVDVSAKSMATGTVLDVLCVSISELTGLAKDEIRTTARLSEYGVDSLLGIRLLNRINSEFKTNFDAALLTLDSIEGIAAEISLKAGDPGNHLSTAEGIDVNATSDWVRPSFIDLIEWDVPASSIAGDDNHYEDQLVLLIQHGFGVWKLGDKLYFECLANSDSRSSLQSLLTNPAALHAGLEEGVRIYPASDMQTFALELSEVQQKTGLNIGEGFWLELPCDLELINQAINDLIRDHSIFRTGARRVAGCWVQQIYDRLTVNCHEIIRPELIEKKQFTLVLGEILREKTVAHFEIQRTPLFDVYVLQNGNDLAAILFVTHHFHADGFTLYLFQQELHDRYQALLNGDSYTAPARFAEYAHFALTQFSPERSDATQYWIKRFQDKGAIWQVQEKSRFIDSSLPKAASLDIEITEAQLLALVEFNRRNNTTLTQLVTSAVAIMMYCMADLNVPIQMVINLRDRYEFESILGDFSASIPLLLEIEPGFSVRDVLDCYQQALLDIQQHKHFDFLALFDRLGTPDQPNLMSGISLDSNDRDTFIRVTDFADKLVTIPMEGREPVASLLVCVVKTHGRLTLPVIYDQMRFSDQGIELFADSLVELLEQIVEMPEIAVDKIDIPIELVDRLSIQGDREHQIP